MPALEKTWSMRLCWSLACLKSASREGQEVVSVFRKLRLVWVVGVGFMSPPITLALSCRSSSVVARPIPEEQPLNR